MSNPIELQYSKSHEWLSDDGTVGITDFAQEALGDVVYIGLPQVGDAVTAGESFGDVESVKAVSDLISPVTGVIVAVNEELEDATPTGSSRSLRSPTRKSCWTLLPTKLSALRRANNGRLHSLYPGAA